MPAAREPARGASVFARREAFHVVSLDFPAQSWDRGSTWMSSEQRESRERVELLQGTLDLIVLQALSTMGAL